MKIHYCIRLIIFIGLVSTGCKSSIKKKSNVIYQEPFEEINTNNNIYKVGTKILFDYYFLKNEDTLKCQILSDRPHFQAPSTLISIKDTTDSKNTVEEFQISVTGSVFFEEQTEISFDLLSKSKEPMSYAQTRTGLVENEVEIWTHPLRIFQFNILEFNPFPHVKFPLKKNHTWQSKLTIYSNPMYDDWISFDEKISCISNYKIKGKVKLNTLLGLLDCYVIESTATTPKSEGFLTSYFNTQYGFVKLDYTNIDGSRLVIEVNKFEQS